MAAWPTSCRRRARRGRRSLSTSAKSTLPSLPNELNTKRTCWGAGVEEAGLDKAGHTPHRLQAQPQGSLQLREQAAQWPQPSHRSHQATNLQCQHCQALDVPSWTPGRGWPWQSTCSCSRKPGRLPACATLRRAQSLMSFMSSNSNN